MLAFYLEGIPLVQIARALQVGIPTVLDFLRIPEVLACIEQYEESTERQTRLCAIASRIPAMATLREVCASEGSLAERRRAASDLLRQSRAAQKPAKGQRFGRTAHSTPNPDKFIPNPDAPFAPDIPTHVRPLEPYEMTPDLPKQAPITSHPSAPIAADSPSEHINDQPSASVSESSQASTTDLLKHSLEEPVQDSVVSALQGSFNAHDHTASWHAFDRVEPNPPASDLDSPSIPEASNGAPHVQPQPDAQAVERPLLVRQPPTRIPSPYDSICPPEITSPLPDAVLVAA
jgi:hypothetical protein